MAVDGQVAVGMLLSWRTFRTEHGPGSRGPGGADHGQLQGLVQSADLKLITSMKNVINWNTMSRIGVRFGRLTASRWLPT